jgi:hypothetical protein
MTRRRLAIASALSLLLCLATAWAWYSTARFTFEDPAMPGPDLYVLKSHPWLGWLSVSLLGGGIVLLVIRDFFPTPLAERIKEGNCRCCGYDLRASKERCPECGTLIRISAEPLGNPVDELTGGSLAPAINEIISKHRPVEYAAVQSRRALRWYHLIPLAVLFMLLTWCIRFAIAHWHDVKAWDI